MARAYFYHSAESWARLAKKFLSFEEQVQQLLDRGLQIEDTQKCQSFLASTNYYRFSGYFRYWQQDPLRGDNSFISGSDFDVIHSVYETEQAFSAECIRALKLAEILLRTQFAHHYANLIYPHGTLLLGEGFTQVPPRKTPPEDLILEDIKRTKEVFIRHYRAQTTNGDPISAYHNLPVWVAVEALSFGTLSRCIEHSASSGVLDAIAQHIGVAKAPLPNQIKSFVYLRNRCAHYSRLWNHSVLDAPPINPNIARRAKREYGNFGNRSIFCILIALDTVLGKSCIEKDWIRSKIMPLLDQNITFKQGIIDPKKYGDYKP